MRLPTVRSASRIGLALAAALTIAGCAFGPPDDTAQGRPPNLPPPPSPSVHPGSGDDSIGVQVLTKNLQTPWGVTFLPDGSALVTERDTRRILSVTSGGLAKPVQTIDAAFSSGEGGLMGIAASPEYEKNKTLFIYYTTRTDNRIAKLELGGKPTPIVTGIPAGASHNGGRIAFGPDGFLYAGTGDASTDASTEGRAQDPKSLGGKILRMTPEGKPAPGNPVADSLVYSSGYRNVEGLAWDAGKRLWATESGQNKLDEVNLVEAGKDYGWPAADGPGTDPKFTNPLVTWAPPDATPSGAAIAGDAMIVACLRGERLYVLALDGSSVTGSPRALLEGKYGRLRDVVNAPDGSLWVLTSNRDGHGQPVPDDDRIIRILPPGSGGVSVL